MRDTLSNTEAEMAFGLIGGCNMRSPLLKAWRSLGGIFRIAGVVEGMLSLTVGVCFRKSS